MIKINFSLCYGVLLGPLAASTSHFRIFTIKANVRVAPRVHHTFFYYSWDVYFTSYASYSIIAREHLEFACRVL